MRTHGARSEGQDTDSELNDAIVLYLQRGRAATPAADEDAVRSSTRHPQPDRLIATVRSLVAESVDIPVDWDQLTLADAGRYAAHVMRQRHPGLNPSALDALAWNFTFTWR